ncbi:MAG: alcohol dehydrogenase catalytic domain-containing protein [Nanoarchaeota archaeon]|nr:alcohol dehydrogenase catalytic domain-containing protein [Nanoarchaeota archaeon]
MKVGMYYNNSDIRVVDMPYPKFKKDEMILKVNVSGICGSDVMEWYRIKKAPLVLGHEIAGEVVNVGSEVTKYKKGDRVTVTHHVPCNTCEHCLKGYDTACDTLHTTNFYPGGFAEYLRVPAINVDRGTFLLDGLSDEEGSFIEPLGCVYRGQKKAGLKSGESVLVLGSGIAGMLHIKLAKAMGAGRIVATDVSEYRLEKALEFGADEVFHARTYKPERFDKVFLCTGNKHAIDQALLSVERGGSLEFFAPADQYVNVIIPVNEFWRNEVKVLTSYGAAPKDLYNALQLIKHKRVEVEDMVSHKFPLEEIIEGFELTAKGGESMKVLIMPHLVVFR